LTGALLYFLIGLMKTLSSFKMPFQSAPPSSQREGADKPKLKKAVSSPATHDDHIERTLFKELKSLVSQDYSPKSLEVIRTIRKASNQLRDKTKQDSFIERMTRLYPALLSLQALSIESKQRVLEHTLKIPSPTEKGKFSDNFVALLHIIIQGVFHDLHAVGKELTQQEEDYLIKMLRTRTAEWTKK
jgi:hypothetical protein